MKKVLILVNHDVVIYNFRKELVERLLEEGYKVYISSPYGERIDDLVNMGCEYIEANISRHGTNIVEDLKLIRYYFKIIKKIKPDIVLTYTIKTNIYGGIACRFLNVPYISNITGLGTAVENPGLMQKLTIILYKIAFKKIEIIFFQNTENMNFFAEKNIYKDKHMLIPGSGVNLKEFCVLEYPNEEIIEFAFIARIMKEKGIDQYLEAAEYIKNKYPNTKFHICGFCEEDYEEKLKKLEAKGTIEYHGMQRNIKKILERVHCTIHPSYYPEGMSNVLLESAACGRAIITTNRSGCCETVEEGVTGFLVEKRNSEDLIKKIEIFINMKYRDKISMGLKGREKMEREFDRKIVVNKYMNIIEKIGSGV